MEFELYLNAESVHQNFNFWRGEAMFCVNLENGGIISFRIDANSLNEKQRAVLFPHLGKTASPEGKKSQNKKRPRAGRQLLLPLFRLIK